MIKYKNSYFEAADILKNVNHFINIVKEKGIEFDENQVRNYLNFTNNSKSLS
jgi:hypothetical protein